MQQCGQCQADDRDRQANHQRAILKQHRQEWEQPVRQRGDVVDPAGRGQLERLVGEQNPDERGCEQERSAQRRPRYSHGWKHIL